MISAFIVASVSAQGGHFELSQALSEKFEHFRAKRSAGAEQFTAALEKFLGQSEAEHSVAKREAVDSGLVRYFAKLLIVN